MALSRQDIEAQRAAATGKEIATRGETLPANLEEIVTNVMEFDGMGSIDRALVAATFGQPNSQWAKALREGGQTAVMVGLRLVREHGLNPLAEPKQLYIMKPDGAWQARLSGHGLAFIASKIQGPDGKPMFRGIDYDYLGEVERGGEPYVVIKARVRWGDGVYSGIGRKPRNMKVGGSKKFDPNAEAKAETMAVRRALEMAAPRDIDWKIIAPALDMTIDGEAEEAPLELAAPGPTGEGGQGVADVPEDSEPPADPTLADQQPGDGSEPPAALITEPQFRAIHKIASIAGPYSHNELSALAKNTYGVDSMKELTAAQASEFIDVLQAEADQKMQAAKERKTDPLGWDE